MALHLFLPLLYSLVFIRSFPNIWSFVFFIVGICIGFQILFFDRVLHAFYLYPESEFNRLVRSLWSNKNYIGFVKALSQAETLQEKLLTRSTLFLIVFVLMTIFVLTSTGSIVGTGIMLGMGLHYTYDFWRYSGSQEKFSKQYLWQVKKTFTDREIRGFVLVWTAFFVLLSLVVFI